MSAAAALACTRRYSSRAAACSSGKPSKPSACEKRTTVELEVFARRASSSAVWKAASSRWSTMYCATSFCEREHSSKRARMYLERLWCSLVPPSGGCRGRRSVGGVATRFIGALVRRRGHSLLPASTTTEAIRSPARIAHRRARGEHDPQGARRRRLTTRCSLTTDTPNEAGGIVRIAIVGAGVSGLVAAHLLHREHEIVVYEANAYAGGHTNTIRVDTAHETHHVDTGFIVMNDRNYPNFTRLLDRLGVATPADAHELLGQGRGARLRVQRHAARAVLPARQPRQPALPADDRRPAALQPRAARPARARGERRVDARLPLAPPLLAGVRRAADRAAAVGRVVGRPASEPAPSRRASSPSSSPTTGCSASATARAGRPSRAARRATWRR